MPRVALGLPMYRSEAFVERAIGSLLAQDYDDFALVAIDDCSPDGTLEVAREAAKSDPRVTVDANPKRLGMVGNWNHVYQRACELHGGFEFFAWVSDNDLREPSWLSTLVRTLDAQPAVVLSCTRVATAGRDKSLPEPFHVRGSTLGRLRRVLRGIHAGSTIYGLQRRAALERVGGVPRVLLSDVLFLSELSLHGEFIQTSEVLWSRGPGGTGGSRAKQRASLFNRRPLLTLAPVSLQHAVWLIGSLVVARRGPVGMGRVKGFAIAAIYLAASTSALIGRRKRGLQRSFAKKLARPSRRRAKRLQRSAAHRLGVLRKERRKASMRLRRRAVGRLRRLRGRARKQRRRATHRLQRAPQRLGWTLRSPIVRVKVRSAEDRAPSGRERA